MYKIIAPKYQHDNISSLLLKDEKTITNVSILPMSSFVQDLIGQQNNEYDQLLKEKLLSLKNQLNILAPYLDNKSFIRSIKDFHIDMHLNQISVESLARNSLKDQDLIVIFKSISMLIPDEIKNLYELKKVIDKHDLSKVKISKQKFYNQYQQTLYKLLKKHGATDFNEDLLKTNKVEIFYANNKRSEVESSAQLLVNNKLDQATIIVLNNEYLPLVEQIYSRYNLNFSLTNPSDNNNFFINFIASVKLIEKKDKVSVNEFLSGNPFNLDKISSLIKLNDFFDFNLSQLLNYKYQPLNDSIVHKSNIEYYRQLAQQAKAPINQLKKIINHIESDKKTQLVENIFNYFLEKCKNEDDNLRQLRQALVKNKEFLNTTENIWPILEEILLKKRNSVVDINNIIVTNIDNHYHFNKKNLIILGASANNYPIINKKIGVIDEKYLENLNYPSKEERFSQQLLEQNSILNGENIYIFFPLSSYDGKAIEPSFNLIQFAQSYKAKAKRYPLIENDPFEYKNYVLNENLAQKLFFQDKQLIGSISSFEQYNHCNYAYFLKHGLRLYPKQLPELSHAYIGSIIHELMEKITNNLIENHTFDKELNLDLLIEDLMSPLRKLYPNDKKIILVKNLLVRQLSDMLTHTRDIEDDTNFKAIKSEAEFLYSINDKIQLKGFVDRTDQHLDALRVIDFKSSAQNLSEKKFKQGLQLQLITYLLAMSDKFNLKPAGAFYQTMRLKNTPVIAAQVTKSKDFYYPLKDEEIASMFLKNNRLSGWHFIEADKYYKSDNYTGGLTIKKSGLSVYGQPKNFNTVATILKEIYLNIYQDLYKGIIDCVPINNPCQYCEFHSICLSKSTNNYKDQIYKDQHLSKEINNEVD